MNYRHSFHAGNFADVLKHITLVRIINYLKEKEAPFRVLDTHAGDGLYSLKNGEAAQTGEWIDGIGKLLNRRLSFAPAEKLLEPYLAIIDELSPLRDLYPGSPLIIQNMLRANDRANFNDLQPEILSKLKKNISKDERLTFTAIDAYQAIKAQVPFKERRGIVFVDPPFEREDEFLQIVLCAKEMAKKWATGILFIWHPIKNLENVARFRADMTKTGFTKILSISMQVAPINIVGSLSACGLIIANPPWILEKEMQILLPALTKALSINENSSWDVRWLLKN